MLPLSRMKKQACRKVDHPEFPAALRHPVTTKPKRVMFPAECAGFKINSQP